MTEQHFDGRYLDPKVQGLFKAGRELTPDLRHALACLLYADSLADSYKASMEECWTEADGVERPTREDAFVHVLDNVHDDPHATVIADLEAAWPYCNGKCPHGERLDVRCPLCQPD